MNNCLISIIVPVYNAEKYICQCMDSLVNQTLESIEIIAIDDGSTDNSLNILEKYKNNDSRVKIICQKNSGASVARNKGLEMAQGDYIFFLDADDYIDNSALSAMYENAIKYNVDIITFNCKSFSDENDNVAERYNRSLDDRKIYSGKEFFSYCYNNSELYGCLWLNFYKSSVIKEKRFIEKIVYEDTPVIFEVFNSDIKVKYIKDQLLYHRLNYNSVMRSSMNNMKIRSNIVGLERMLLLYKNDTNKIREQLLFIRWVASTHFSGLRALEIFDTETQKLCRRFNGICIENRKLLSKSLFKEYSKLFIKSPIKAFKAIL